MSENKCQFQTGIVINGKSQITVARHLRCCGIFNEIYCKFNVEYAVKNLRPVNIWLGYRQESWLSHALCVPGHCPAERWRNC